MAIAFKSPANHTTPALCVVLVQLCVLGSRDESFGGHHGSRVI